MSQVSRRLRMGRDADNAALDLLASPDMVTCDFMSHPLIAQFVHHVYYHGLPFASRTKTGVLYTLEASITPRSVLPRLRYGDGAD
jgi:hypothetical protein